MYKGQIFGAAALLLVLAMAVALSGEARDASAAVDHQGLVHDAPEAG